MGRKAKVIRCGESVRKELERMAGSQSTEVRLVRRCRIVLGCLDGKRVRDISRELGEQEDVIRKWRDRFESLGIPGLHDAPRSGTPMSPSTTPRPARAGSTLWKSGSGYFRAKCCAARVSTTPTRLPTPFRPTSAPTTKPPNPSSGRSGKSSDRKSNKQWRIYADRH